MGANGMHLFKTHLEINSFFKVPTAFRFTSKLIAKY
jgi:hypothetical protein